MQGLVFYKVMVNTCFINKHLQERSKSVRSCAGDGTGLQAPHHPTVCVVGGELVLLARLLPLLLRRGRGQAHDQEADLARQRQEPEKRGPTACVGPIFSHFHLKYHPKTIRARDAFSAEWVCVGWTGL